MKWKKIIKTQRNIIRSHELEIRTLKEHAQELTQQRNDLVQALRAHMHPNDSTITRLLNRLYIEGKISPFEHFNRLPNTAPQTGPMTAAHAYTALAHVN